VKLVGELLEVISDRAGLRNIREVGERLRSARQSHDGLTNTSSADVVGVGQTLIAEMKGTTGDGPPDTGARFSHAHSAFSKAGETLKASAPGDSWDGSAARGYVDQNTRQQLRIETLSDADLEVHRVLYREAAQISRRRGFIDDQSKFVADTSHATFPLQFIPGWGEAARLALEMQAVQTALTHSTWHMYQLHTEVRANAAELQQAIRRYRSVLDSAEKSGASGQSEAAPAAERKDFGGENPPTALTAKLNPDASPMPPAGLAPQDGN
jgi:hypothetical protein